MTRAWPQPFEERLPFADMPRASTAIPMAPLALLAAWAELLRRRQAADLAFLRTAGTCADWHKLPELQMQWLQGASADWVDYLQRCAEIGLTAPVGEGSRLWTVPSDLP